MLCLTASEPLGLGSGSIFLLVEQKGIEWL